MRLLAIAFHESISVRRLHELFRSELNQLFGGTTAAHCSHCEAQFAVFFPNGDDPENRAYLATIEERISEDCRDGKHNLEIVLNG